MRRDLRASSLHAIDWGAIAHVLHLLLLLHILLLVPSHMAVLLLKAYQELRGFDVLGVRRRHALLLHLLELLSNGLANEMTAGTKYNGEIRNW